MPSVEGILETCLYVDDLTTAEKFYAQIFGITPFARDEERHLFFYCGNSLLLLFKPDRTARSEDVPAHGANGPGHIAFRMHPNDVPAWREHLQSCDVPIETEITWPTGGYSIYFRDPAGNSLELATPQLWGL